MTPATSAWLVLTTPMRCASPKGRAAVPNDHRHRYGTMKPYNYEDAAKLIDDFWELVDQVLKEKRGKP
jgi:1,2-phenylacetyl-CoA epoxidase PaaB subunit